MRPYLNEKDRGWISALFGTAVGAGVLYLPIKAAQIQFPILLGIIIISVPCIWLAHRNLAEFCLYAAVKNEHDITSTVVEQFGRKWGFILILSYFISIFPISLLYSISLTNIINDSLYKFFNIQSLSKVWLSLFILAILNFILYKGEKWILKTCEVLIIPLAIILLFCSLYFMRIWKMPTFDSIYFIESIPACIALIPLIVFSFNHTPACSAVAQSYHLAANSKTEGSVKVRRILSVTIILLAGIILPFVLSCVLSLTTQDISYAISNNIPALIAISAAGYISWMPYVISIITLLAITSSYFGVYLGTAEGGVGLVRFMINARHVVSKKVLKRIHLAVHAGIFLSSWLAASLNFSVIDIILNIVSPVLAILLFFMPIYAKYTDHKLKKLRSPIADIIILIFGSIVVIGLITSFVT
ncbi:MAG: hypothetical protein HAW62_06140 [Endozoicomonadaceae bacterium]|nr:hypothetical protein [Endozoicomonadaceae bacterium]